MTLHIKHLFKLLKGDGPDATIVRPKDWNDDHDLQTASQRFVMGRDNTGPGPIQELPLDIEVATGRMQVLGTSGFTPPQGSTALRPALARNGEIRWNNDLAAIEIFNLGGSGIWSVISISSFMPPGAVVAFATSNVPAGWYLCNGQTLSRAANPLLFQQIATYYGNGDNTGLTFSVPNFLGRTLVCIDGGPIGLGTAYGVRAESITLGLANMPLHRHGLLDTGNNPVSFPLPGDTGGGTSGGGNVLGGGGANVAFTDYQPPAPAQPFTISHDQPSVGVYYNIRGG